MLLVESTVKIDLIKKGETMNTKFNIGDELFYISDNGIQKGKVEQITIYVSTIKYEVEEEILFEFQLGRNIDLLIGSLKKEYEDRN